MLQQHHEMHPVYGENDTGQVSGLPFREKRTVTLFMLGRLWHRGSDTICRIRNISCGGMLLEICTSLEVDEPVLLETRSGSYVDGQVAWTRDGLAGVRFVSTVEQETLLATPSGRAGKALAVRGPRFPAAARAKMRIDGRRVDACVVNISLRGCAIVASKLPPRGSVGELSIAGLTPLKFAPCWERDDHAGLAFLDRVAFADLARWLGEPAQRFALEGGKVPEGHGPYGAIRSRSS